MPSAIACFASSAGSVRRTAVWISREPSVRFFAERASAAPSVANFSRRSTTKLFKIFTDLELSVSFDLDAPFSTLEMYDAKLRFGLRVLFDADEVTVRVDPATRRATSVRFPNATTEGPGMRFWRDHLHALNRAGFDVLAYDRRGEGLSGGFSDTNTLEQSEDIFRVLEQMDSGRGLRVLMASGQEFEGAPAAGKLMAGMKSREIPLLLLGYSRGSMTTGWAMTKNYAGGCSYDMPTVRCSAPKGYANIKGAILYASFVSGAGYLPEAPDLADRNLFLGGMAADNYVAFYPNSAVLANMPKWPAVFFAKGLWDRAESLEGTVAAYDRVRGLKDIVVSRGPHSMETWPRQELDRVRGRMVAFATAAVQGRTALPQAQQWTDLKGLVATTPDVWEMSSKPR